MGALLNKTALAMLVGRGNWATGQLAGEPVPSFSGSEVDMLEEGMSGIAGLVSYVVQAVARPIWSLVLMAVRKLDIFSWVKVTLEKKMGHKRNLYIYGQR